MPTRSARSKRPAIFSTPRSQNVCTTTSIRRAARAIPKRPMSRSAAVSRSPTRCCAAAACSNHQRQPDMKIAIRRFVGLLLLAGSCALGAGAAQAHPHVWITATSELIYAPDGSITGVRHAWTFDDMFSTYALQGIETKTKGVYSREELGSLAQTNVESLKEFGFFTFARAAGKNPVKLVGAPAACQMKFQRTNDGTANAQKLGEQNFLSGENSNFGMMFA